MYLHFRYAYKFKVVKCICTGSAVVVFSNKSSNTVLLASARYLSTVCKLYSFNEDDTVEFSLIENEEDWMKIEYLIHVLNHQRKNIQRIQQAAMKDALVKFEDEFSRRIRYAMLKEEINQGNLAGWK